MSRRIHHLLLRCLLLNLIGLSAQGAFGLELLPSRQTAETVQPTRPEVVIEEIPAATKTAWTYVICHGMGGTTPGDNFHELAKAVHAKEPEARVILIDWSPASQAEWFGVQNPWAVSQKIPGTAKLITAELACRKLDLTRTTLIGESFGVAMMALTAKELGGVARILACNPASDLGGIRLETLTDCATRTWSLHTDSIFDTQRQLAHADLLLNTGATDSFSKHTSGIPWLTEQVNAGRLEWLHMDVQLPSSQAAHFGTAVDRSGKLTSGHFARKPADQQSARHSRPGMMSVKMTVKS